MRFGCLAAAINLHKSLLNGISHAPLAYFDQTPSGRILSRFSKDVDVLDVILPETIKWFLYCSSEVITHFLIQLNFPATLFWKLVSPHSKLMNQIPSLDWPTL